jgi:hypothetical protein
LQLVKISAQLFEGDVVGARGSLLPDGRIAALGIRHKN